MQRKSIIAILIIIAGFVVLAIGVAYDLNTANKASGMQYAHGQINQTETETNTRTFEDCLKDGMTGLTFFRITPTENLTAADLIDPTLKKMIINICTFYHEKTGRWIDVFNEEDRRLSDQYGLEFVEKYGDTFPEKVKDMMPSEYGR